jgi:sec-independent protein translocase protein TatA
MGAFSPWHLIIVVLVLVLLFGSKKIPELAKGLGQGLKEFKKATKDAENEVNASSKPAETAEKTEKKDAAAK